MKRLFVLIGLCLACHGRCSATFVQGANGSAVATTSASFTFGSAPAVGDTIILGCRVSSAGLLTSITETGVVYTSAVVVGSSPQIAVFIGVVGGGASASGVVNFSTSVAATVSAMDFAGGGTFAYDVSASSTASGTSGTTASTAQASEVWCCFFSDQGVSPTYSAPTLGFAIASNSFATDGTLLGEVATYDIVTSIGTAHSAVTVGGTSSSSINCCVTFKAITGGSGKHLLPVLGSGG